MTITPEDARRIVRSDHKDWKEVPDSRTLLGQRRWVTETRAVFRHKPTGKTYAMNWDAPSTELQEDIDAQDMFGHQPEIELQEVVWKEVTVEQWVAVA